MKYQEDSEDKEVNRKIIMLLSKYVCVWLQDEQEKKQHKLHHLVGYICILHQSKFLFKRHTYPFWNHVLALATYFNNCIYKLTVLYAIYA